MCQDNSSRHKHLHQVFEVAGLDAGLGKYKRLSISIACSPCDKSGLPRLAGEGVGNEADKCQQAAGSKSKPQRHKAFNSLKSLACSLLATFT